MVIVVMGVSGSGKSTVARRLAAKLGWNCADADDFHPPANVEKMRRRIALTDEDRRPWLAALAEQIRQWRQTGVNGILACSALTEESRRMLGVDGREVRLVYLKGSYQLIHTRIAARKDHFMPAELLRSQFQTLQEPRDAIEVDVSADPDRIVEDIVDRLEFKRRAGHSDRCG
jgi:gluconokinase